MDAINTVFASHAPLFFIYTNNNDSNIFNVNFKILVQFEWEMFKRFKIFEDENFKRLACCEEILKTKLFHHLKRMKF